MHDDLDLCQGSVYSVCSFAKLIVYFLCTTVNLWSVFRKRQILGWIESRLWMCQNVYGTHRDSRQAASELVANIQVGQTSVNIYSGADSKMVQALLLALKSC